MATLSISKTYSDDTLLSASDIDAIIDSVETFVNTTGLNNDNITNNSVTANTKIKTASITTAKIANEAVTSAKLADGAISTEKVLNAAVTAAKIADDSLLRSNFYALAPLANPGTTVMFHTFNGAVSVPRGWMICDGSIVTEANYNTLHGAGTATADGIAGSPLLGKFIPNFVNKYAIGSASTTATGGSAIGSVGSPNNTADLSHTHTMASHVHVKTEWGGTFTAGGGPDPNQRYDFDEAFSSSAPLDVTVSSELEAVDIQPESIEFIYIIKVV